MIAPPTTVTRPTPAARRSRLARAVLADLGLAPSPIRRARIGGVSLILKDETRQPTNNYKVRGATWALWNARLRGHERVVFASTGNFAAAVGWVAGQYGIEAQCFVPEGTCPSKLANMRAHGLRIVEHGQSFDDACHAAVQLARRDPSFHLLHAYDDCDTIEGQGTLALELREQAPDYDTVVVQVGGGGLFAGLALVHRVLAPHVRLWAVTTEHNSAFARSYAAGVRCDVAVRPGSIANGVAVGSPGRRCWPLFARGCHGVATVDETEIKTAMAWLHRRGIRAEGAGAVGLAAVQAGRISGRRIAVLVTGANISDAAHAAALREARQR